MCIGSAGAFFAPLSPKLSIFTTARPVSSAKLGLEVDRQNQRDNPLPKRGVRVLIVHLTDSISDTAHNSISESENAEEEEDGRRKRGRRSEKRRWRSKAK